MANNYTHFSFAIKINSPAEAEWLETIEQSADSYDEGGSAKDIIDDVLPEFEEFGNLGYSTRIKCDADGGEAWFHDDGGEGNVGFVVDVLQAYLLKFKITKPIFFSWAETCDSPRTDEFGGGAVVFDAFGAEWMNTSDWIRRKLAERKS